MDHKVRQQQYNSSGRAQSRQLRRDGMCVQPLWASRFAICITGEHIGNTTQSDARCEGAAMYRHFVPRPASIFRERIGSASNEQEGSNKMRETTKRVQ